MSSIKMQNKEKKMNITEPTEWVGKCHDCRKPLCVHAFSQGDGVAVSGGAVFDCGSGRMYLKCPVCYRRKPFLTGNKDCAVYAGFYPADETDDRFEPEEPDDYLLWNEK